ncbi:MAG: glycosidase [bacterium]|nr:glycosidase [bacterium]
MDRQTGRDIVARSPKNPLITLSDLPFSAGDIWNAAVVHFEDEYLMLFTVEELEGHYSIYRADSTDGEEFTINPEPFMVRSESPSDAMYESVGVRDPRITKIDGEYFITYVADGDHGLRVALARTRDFNSVERLGYLTQVDVKNGVMFPRKINDKYVLLKRPDAGASIWLSYSEDLEFWGECRAIMTPRGGFWDSTRIGASAPPIEIPEGWLLIYYGEKGTSAGPLVRLGAVVLDRDDPSRVLARSNVPILAPRERYERIGDVPNVVFSTGVLLEDGCLKVYYGASDSCICLATVPLEVIVRTCFDSGREF